LECGCEWKEKFAKKSGGRLSRQERPHPGHVRQRFPFVDQRLAEANGRRRIDSAEAEDGGGDKQAVSKKLRR
jgi:hypothetical protein